MLKEAFGTPMGVILQYWNLLLIGRTLVLLSVYPILINCTLEYFGDSFNQETWVLKVQYLKVQILLFFITEISYKISKDH